MVVASSATVKPIKRKLKKIKTEKLREKLRKPQPSFKHYVKKIEAQAKK